MSSCLSCHQTFDVPADEQAFHTKHSIPPPKLCPPCRRFRRLLFRNDRKLYRRVCDLCQKQIVSVYDAQAPFPVYCPTCWWSDQWNATSYGRSYHPNRPFFEQWNELNHAVPHIALWQIQNQNSDFSHDASYNKNCYMIFGADYNQDCFYAWCAIKNNDICDSSAIYECQRCYECTDCFTCQFCKYSQLLRNSSNCDFSFDLANCHFCFGCTGLRNKSYYWFNESIGKDEFLRRYQALTWTWPEVWQHLQQAFQTSLATPRRAEIFKNCEECSGNFLGNCKNVKETFDGESCRDIKNALLVMETKDALDCEILYYNIEVVYESQTLIRNCNNVMFSYFLRDTKNAKYCNECYISQDLFGCVGMRSGKYAILNKVYSKEEYEALCAQIEKEMRERGEFGEFFPAILTPFTYNETAAIDYLDPLDKEAAETKGLRWKDADPKEYQPQTYAVPENIRDVTEAICQELLACGSCGKNFRIIPQEFHFYKDMKLPIPANCFDCRHTSRIRRRGPRKLFDRSCANCGSSIRTTYAPSRPERVYCEKCYLESVY